MTLAEEAFHDYISQSCAGKIEDGSFVRLFNGRKDLADIAAEDFRTLLGDIKANMNRWLAERKRVDDQVDDLPFDFDYIDSKFSTAIAFRDRSCAFIGSTVTFVEDLLHTAQDLGRSEGVRQILGFDDEVEDELEVVFFRNLLNLTVTHEFTHHVHGHVLRQQGNSNFFTEFDSSEQEGGLPRQADEADADGYAVYHVLANALDSQLRNETVSALRLQNAPVAHVDEILFLVFLIAVCAHFSISGLLDIGDAERGYIDIFSESHPPQAARLDCLTRRAVLWCKANRPALAVWITQERFREIMSTVAEAMGGPESHRPWNNQAAFLRSERGKEYMRQFTSLIDAQKKNVRKTPAKAQRSVVLQTPLRTCTVSYQDAD